MSRISRSALALSAVFFALVITGCGGGGVPEGDVAKVDNLTISKETYDRWFKTASTSQPGAVAPDPPAFTKCVAAKVKAAPEPVKGQPQPKKSDYLKQCQQEYDQLKQQVMTFLVRSTWLEAEADKLGVKVSDKEAADAFAKARKQAFPKTADYVKFLKTSGQTEADLIYRQSVQLLEQKITEKIQKDAKKVTDKDISEYYEKNKDKQFVQPASRDLLVVLTQSEAKAKKAKEALDGGSSWVRVVKDYSSDPTTKDADGVLPNVTQGTGNKQFEDAVFKAKKGEVVGPVKTTDGYYVFEVTKSRARKETKLAEVKESIRSIITQQRAQEALAKFGVDYQDRWRKETECASGYISPDCSNAKQQPNSTVPPGAIPGQTTTQQQEGALPASEAGQPQVPQQTQP
jgi:foldase protein PrsA